MCHDHLRESHVYLGIQKQFPLIRRGFLGVALATLLICAPAFSQINYGRILGSVTDPSGAVVSGATVTVTNTQTNVSRTLTTDSSGAYVAAALNPGTYTVR